MKIGDRVKLKARIYSSCEFNPSIGSIYECLGKIYEVHGSSTCAVYWDNGEENSYSVRDLIFIETDETKLFLENILNNQT
jgi:hypothetical protein